MNSLESELVVAAVATEKEREPLTHFYIHDIVRYTIFVAVTGRKRTLFLSRFDHFFRLCTVIILSINKT